MSDGVVLAILAVAITTGALVQGTLGLGLGLVAAPVVTLVDASLMPELMLWLAAVLPHARQACWSRFLNASADCSKPSAS